MEEVVFVEVTGINGADAYGLLLLWCAIGAEGLWTGSGIGMDAYIWAGDEGCFSFLGGGIMSMAGSRLGRGVVDMADEEAGSGATLGVGAAVEDAKI